MQPKKFNPKTVPAALKQVDSWLVWKLVSKVRETDGVTVLLKVPYYADGTRRKGILGSTTDRRKLTSFSRALEVYGTGNYSGLGFAPMPEYDLTILDLDKCISAHGEYSEFANAVVESGTYVERSPSGRGLRAIYTGGAVTPGKRNGFIENGERVEIYCGNAFVTITGDRVDGSSRQATDLPEELAERLAPVISGGGTHNPDIPTSKHEDGGALVSPDAAPIPEFTIDHAKVVLNKLPETWGQPGHGSWYKVAAALHLQFDGSEEGYEILDSWSQGIEGYDQESNRKRWKAGFSHASGKTNLTTMKNLVFEAVNNGGLRVRKETMQKWKLARTVDDDFDLDPDVDSVAEEAVLPEFIDLTRMSDIGEMLGEEAPPVDWLVENFVARRNVTLLGGGSGTSKSFFTMQMCMCAAAGTESFGGMVFPRTPLRTLYLAYEDSKEVMHGRIYGLKKYVGERMDILGDESYVADLRSNFSILTSEVLDSGAWTLVKQAKKYEPLEITKLAAYLRDYITSRGIDMLVIDTGSEVHTGDENSTADMVILSRVLRQLATAANCGILVLQHVQKGIWNNGLEEVNQASIRGSGVIVDKARNVVMALRMPRKDATRFGLEDNADTHDNYIVFKHVKANLGGYVPLTIFERSSTGSLVHRPDIREQDLTAIVAQEEEAVEETAEAKNMARLQRHKDMLLAFIIEQNASDVNPSSTMARSWCMNNGMSDQRARTVLSALEAEGSIQKIQDPDYPRSSNWHAEAPLMDI